MIDFYYWGTQCPYNYSNIQILKKIEEDYDIQVRYHDLTMNHNLARDLKLFSPTMTVFDAGLRWSGPITYDLLVKYINGEEIKRKPYIVESKNQGVKGELKAFIPERSNDIANLCCSRGCHISSREKGKWLASLAEKYDVNHLGILHYVDGKCVGGVEYIPSLEVPYAIPKSKDFAFITCVYASDPIYDYKSYPLNKLEEELRAEGYKKIYAIASKKVAFPNGPLDWFVQQGYNDLGLLFYEDNDDAYQHLIEKSI